VLEEGTRGKALLVAIAQVARHRNLATDGRRRRRRMPFSVHDGRNERCNYRHEKRNEGMSQQHGGFSRTEGSQTV
jgi:hypothetical protein